MAKLVVFSGAGVSAESGISTFRSQGGLWEKYKIDDVATPEGWNKSRETVLSFYNERRTHLLSVEPNEAHKKIAELEKHFKEVVVITQNIDDLHERAGSTNVIHMHGELLKSRSTLDPSLVYECKNDINVGDKCERGSQLRPHVVWFGENVMNLDAAAQHIEESDVLLVIGTSLNVWPAAGLIYVATGNVYCIDPADVSFSHPFGVTPDSEIKHIKKNATEGMNDFFDRVVVKAQLS